jgi:hypothetical protein
MPIISPSFRLSVCRSVGRSLKLCSTHSLRPSRPLAGRELTVRYKYKSDQYVFKRTDYATLPTNLLVRAAGNIDNYEVFAGPEQTGWSTFAGNSTTSSANSIVTVSEVGSDRVWHTGLDGTPAYTYNSNVEAHTCSKRGLCDYETGLCDCFEGYHGTACNKRQ